MWALFVDPQFAQQGIGKQLHKLMLDWYFEQTTEDIVLGTAPNTRAERFYEFQGWSRSGSYANGEVKFELSHRNWTNRSRT